MPHLFYIIFFLFLTTISCNGPERKGYRRIAEDIYIRLKFLGDGQEEASQGDYISINTEFLTTSDSLLFRGTRRFRIGDSEMKNSLNRVFTGLREGDSINLLIGVATFFQDNLDKEVPAFLDRESFIKMNFKLEDIQSREEFNEEKEMFLKWAGELKKNEKDLIQDYIEKEELKAEAGPGGSHFIRLRKGTGPQVTDGKYIRVHYEGRFLNGKFFDSTVKRNEPVDFIFGREYILIPGLEKAVGQMKEGERALVILPSELAFGSKGSLGGFIPPYTSLIYEVEILEVE